MPANIQNVAKGRASGKVSYDQLHPGICGPEARIR